MFILCDIWLRKVKDIRANSKSWNPVQSSTRRYLNTRIGVVEIERGRVARVDVSVSVAIRWSVSSLSGIYAFTWDGVFIRVREKVHVVIECVGCVECAAAAVSGRVPRR